MLKNRVRGSYERVERINGRRREKMEDEEVDGKWMGRVLVRGVIGIVTKVRDVAYRNRKNIDGA